MEWFAVIGAALASPLLLEAMKMLTKSLSGREAKKRSELDKAWAEADRQAKLRRKAEEHAHMLRRLLIDAPCVDVGLIPEWPASATGPINTKSKDDDGGV